MTDNVPPASDWDTMGDVIHLQRTDPNSGGGLGMLDLLPSWSLALDQEDKSTGTIRSYTDTIKKAAKWLTDAGMPTDVEAIEPGHLRAWLAFRKDETSPGNAAKEYRNLSVFFRWCVGEGERTPPSPMDRVGKIKVSEKVFPIFTDDELRALVKACAGTDFESRRDLAIIRIMMDNGVRVSGCAGLRYTPGEETTHDVYPSRHVLRVRLKGGREEWVPIGKKAAVALDRYIRVRARHPAADSPYLWLPVDSRTTRAGERRLTAHGIGQMIERRGVQAGIRAHPHKFRRSMASTWEGDVVTLMRIGGWQSIEMARHYGKAREQERAHEAHARLSPGDRI